MQLHELQPNNPFKRKRRVGRGGKKGTYSGTGGKGQKGRAGSRFKPLIREWLKKYPKLKGYNFNIIEEPRVVVDLAKIEKQFEAKTLVNPTTLAAKGLVSRRNGKLPYVKIMGAGDISKAIVVSSCEVSAKAKEKIEKAGGEVKEFKKPKKVLTEKKPKAKLKEKK
jgi:large subunit ribosomal protein L15